MHRAQAEENYALADQMFHTSPLWANVIAFYSALHYLDEYAACKKVYFVNHYERLRWLQNQPELDPITAKYNGLYVRSRIARYDCPPATDPVRSPGVSAKILKWVEVIRNHIVAEEAKRSLTLP